MNPDQSGLNREELEIYTGFGTVPCCHSSNVIELTRLQPCDGQHSYLTLADALRGILSYR